MRGEKQLAAAKNKSTPAVATRVKKRSLLPSSSEEGAEEPGPSQSAGSGGGTQEEGAATTALCKPQSLWALKGALAGRAAADASRAQRPYSVEPPAAVTAAGAEAELEWLVAFEDKFKTGTAVVQVEDRVVSGLVKKKKRVHGTTEPNKNGLAGLKESSAQAVSVAVYAMVRDEFFLPDDHAQAAVRSHLAEEGFTFTDEDFTTWWEDLGHAMVLNRFKAARHSLVDSMKQSLWLVHSACRAACCIACCVPYGAADVHLHAVGTSTPPTQLEANAKRRTYDTTQTAGAEASSLLASWKSATTADMPAPWRQTAGAGGSEFGKLKWLTALKCGFKKGGETPVFKLWQLALADHVVRILALHSYIALGNEAGLAVQLTKHQHACAGEHTH